MPRAQANGIQLEREVVGDPAARPLLIIGMSGGEATAAAVPGARLPRIPGLRHELPRGVWATLADAIAEKADRSGGDA